MQDYNITTKLMKPLSFPITETGSKAVLSRKGSAAPFMALRKDPEEEASNHRT